MAESPLTHAATSAQSGGELQEASQFMATTFSGTVGAAAGFYVGQDTYRRIFGSPDTRQNDMPAFAFGGICAIVGMVGGANLYRWLSGQRA